MSWLFFQGRPQLGLDLTRSDTQNPGSQKHCSPPQGSTPIGGQKSFGTARLAWHGNPGHAVTKNGSVSHSFWKTPDPSQVVLKRWSICSETWTWFQQLVSVVLPDAFANLGNHKNNQRLPNHKEPRFRDPLASALPVVALTWWRNFSFVDLGQQRLQWADTVPVFWVLDGAFQQFSAAAASAKAGGTSWRCDSWWKKDSNSWFELVPIGSKKSRGLMLFDRTMCSWQIDQSVCPFSQLSLSSLQNPQ